MGFSVRHYLEKMAKKTMERTDNRSGQLRRYTKKEVK
jgi:hypothetical protein